MASLQGETQCGTPNLTLLLSLPSVLLLVLFTGQTLPKLEGQGAQECSPYRPGGSGEGVECAEGQKVDPAQEIF